MTRVEVRIDPERLRQRLAWDPDSGPARKAARLADATRDGAARRAPVNTGRLSRSIRVDDPTAGRAGLAWDVVAPQPYAQWIIRGRRRDRRVRGGIVYAHAGPRPFMSEALADAVRQVLG